MRNAFSHIVAGWGCESNRQIGFVSFVRARVRSCVGARAVRERFSNRWLGRIQSSAYFSPYFCVPGMGRWDPCDIILRGVGGGLNSNSAFLFFELAIFESFIAFGFSIVDFLIVEAPRATSWYFRFLTSGKTLFLFLNYWFFEFWIWGAWRIDHHTLYLLEEVTCLFEEGCWDAYFQMTCLFKEGVTRLSKGRVCVCVGGGEPPKCSTSKFQLKMQFWNTILSLQLYMECTTWDSPSPSWVWDFTKFKVLKIKNLTIWCWCLQKNKTLLWVSNMCEVGHKYESKIKCNSDNSSAQQFENPITIHYTTQLDVHALLFENGNLKPIVFDVNNSIFQRYWDFHSQIQKWEIWEDEFESNLWEVDWVQCRVTRGLA